jgi:hypothetical protein
MNIEHIYFEDASSNPARANEFFVARLQCQINMNIEHIILTKRTFFVFGIATFWRKMTSQTWRQKINS